MEKPGRGVRGAGCGVRGAGVPGYGASTLIVGCSELRKGGILNRVNSERYYAACNVSLPDEIV